MTLGAIPLWENAHMIPPVRRLRLSTVIAVVAGLWPCMAFSEAAAQLPVFTERREAAGIAFKHRANPTADKYLVETMGGGVAVFDFNNDSRLDILFVNSGSLVKTDQGVTIDRSQAVFWNRLYENEGDGAFSDVTEKSGLSGSGTAVYGMGVATGDYDNDGLTDVLLTGFPEARLYRNRGGGRFEDVTGGSGLVVPGWSVSAGFFDYDRDGLLDLFVTRYLDWDFSKHIECGKAVRVYCTPKRHQPVSNMLFHNDGDGAFSDVSARSGVGRVLGKALGVAFHDYDADGWTDVVVANDSVAQLLFRNNRDGTFSELALESGLAYNDEGGSFSGMGVAFDDYNNDSLPDVLITNLAKELYALYRNDGQGLFTYVTRSSYIGRITSLMSGWGTRFFDHDLDGRKDVFVAQSHVMDNVEVLDSALVYRQPPLMARNIGGKFEDVSASSGAAFRQDYAGRGAAFGDLDNDGDIDVVMAVLDAEPLLLYSGASERGGHWLIVNPEGRASNRPGAGAKIHIRDANGGEQWGYSTTAGSYLSASDHRVHFGLGATDRLEWVRIEWPSGAQRELKDVGADQILSIEEPAP